MKDNIQIWLAIGKMPSSPVSCRYLILLKSFFCCKQLTGIYCCQILFTFQYFSQHRSFSWFDPSLSWSSLEQEVKTVSDQGLSCCICPTPKIMQYIYGIIPYMLDCCVDPVVHLLLKSSTALLPLWQSLNRQSLTFNSTIVHYLSSVTRLGNF